MIVEIKGVEFENRGSQLMLWAVVNQLREWWPKVRFAMRSSSIATPEQLLKIPAIRKLSLRKNIVDFNRFTYILPKSFRDRLLKFDIVLEADIDMIIDASGFSYSDQLPSTLRLYHLQNELLRFRRWQKPYVFLPQAFGPFKEKGIRDLVRASFKHAAMICARERQSLAYVKSATGELNNLYQYPDFTNLIKAPDSTIKACSIKTACIIPNCHMVENHSSNHGWINSYNRVVCYVIECYQAKGLSPFFLNLGGQMDAELINIINETLSSPIPVLVEQDAIVAKGRIAWSDAVFCSRYHGCVSALSQGISCIGTSWSHKYEMLFADYGADELLLPQNASLKHCKKVIDISIDENSAVNKRILEQSLKEKAKSGLMWSEFHRIVGLYDAFADKTRI